MLQIIRLTIAVLIVFSSGVIQAASPGLPFTEDFTDTALQDTSQTNARWDTDEEQLTLSRWQRRFGALQEATTTGSNITADADRTRAIAVGDVDGDGYLDVIAGNGGRNRVYLNNGSADAFNGVIGTDISSDINDTRAIALGDVDGDGDIDVVVGNFSGTLRMYLNNGSVDPFNNAIGVDITADGNFANAIALGDVDGDGDLDVVVGNRFRANRLYLNNGTTEPFNGVTGRNISASRNNTSAIALGDADGDGDLDVIAGNSSNRLNAPPNQLYLNNGSADPFNGVTGVDIGADIGLTFAIAVGDVDGDGNLDVIAGNNGQTNRLYLNNGSAEPFNGVTGVRISADIDDTRAILLGDVDGDGDLDVIAGNRGQPNRLTLNNGTTDPFNGVTSANITEDTNITSAMALGDIDGDGDLDVIVGNENTPNRLHLNNGNANPFNGVASTNISADSDLTNAIAVGDVDGDGDLDIVVGNRASQPNRLYLNNGSADPFNDVTGVDITADRGFTRSIALGDIDGDGDLDLIEGNEGNVASDRVNRLYLNNGSAAPFNGVIGVNIAADANNTQAIALGDVDGDGDLDIVAGNALLSDIIVDRLFLNNGSADPFSGVIGTNIGVPGRVSTNAIALGDVDGDGDLDVIAGNSGRNQLILNNGTADPFNGVAGTNITDDNNNTSGIALGDVDGDGDLDVVVGNGIDTNRLYLNNGSTAPFNLVVGVNITVSDLTLAIALGDVDGDGDLDVIAGNEGQTTRLTLNSGSANRFNPIAGMNISGERLSFSIATGDVDRDGDLDIVVGNVGLGTTSGRPNQLFLNNGSATPFRGVAGVNITNDTHRTNSILLGDVDGDGDLDVVAGNGSIFDSQPNRLYLNNGSADPFNGITGVNISNSGRTLSAALGDVDGDGDLDVVFGNAGLPVGNPNRLFLNNGSVNPFEGVTGTDITSDNDRTSAIALGDIDGDGDLDIIAGNGGASRGRNRLYLNNGNAAPFSGVTGVNITLDSDPTVAIALGDVEGDGDLDVVAGNNGEPNRLYLNNGSANPFDNATRVNIPDTNSTLSIALDDVDSDGDLDVVAGNFGTNQLYLNNGSVTPFEGIEGINITTDGGATRSIALGDVNGDGGLDILAANGNSQMANRLYQRSPRFDTARNMARSLRVDTQTSNISSATLSDVQTQPRPSNTSVDYYLSNNGGAQWFITQPGRPFTFPTIGNDLRWRAELQSLSPALTPVIGQIDITSGADASLTLTIQADSVSEADGSAATTATVSRNSNTTGQLTITLSSSDTSEATVPTSVTIAAGQSISPPFVIAAVDDAIIDGTQTVTITASAAGLLDDTGSLEVLDDDDNDGDGVPKIEDNCPDDPNPNQADFEGDGIGDVCDSDTDGDGLPDTYELANGLNPINSLDRDADPDGDGFTNIEEFEFGSDPQIADTDDNGNGIPDAVENRAPVIVPILQLLLLDDDE